MEEIKENEKNRILHRTLIPDQSGFKTSDAEMFKYDKYKGWYVASKKIELLFFN